MSRGPWKSKRPRQNPDGNATTSVLLLISERYAELAALDSRSAQVNGELAELYRTAHKHDKAAPPDQEQEAALSLTG